MTPLTWMTRTADIRFLKGRVVDPRRPEPIPAQALRIALFDEMRAHVFYSMVIERHGPRSPFVAIVESEARHIDGLARIALGQGVPIPANIWRAELTVPRRFEDCCAAGAVAEEDNAEMYERFLDHPLPPELRAAFQARRHASDHHHRPAFLHCADHGALERAEEARRAKAREPLWWGVAAGAGTVLLARAVLGRGKRDA